MAAQPPRSRLPPLTALRAFEAAGRLGGFTPAALELGVTPGAVTAHLKTLESQLGAPLFKRHHKGVTLTDLGARVLPDFTAAFASLTTAAQRLEAEAAPDVVRIATTSDLALLWLSPRLPALRGLGAQIVPVVVPNAQAALGRADVGVFLDDADPGAGAPLVAVSAPGVLTPGASPDILRGDQCLRLRGEDWQAGDWAPWVASAGLALEPSGAAYDQAALALEDAANGAGVLMVALPLAEAALRGGRIVEPFGLRARGAVAVRVRALKDLSGHPMADAILRRLVAEQNQHS